MNKRVVFEDGEWWYYESDSHRRRYKSAEAHGKCCKMCGIALDQENWAEGNLRKNVYICRVCDGIKGKRNRLKRLAANIGNASRQSYNKVKDGYVYAIVNPAWPKWVKVGMAIDVEDRCSSYQTSSPYRDYEVLFSYHCVNRRREEQKLHDAIGAIAEEVKGEWFLLDPKLVIAEMKKAAC